MPPKRRRFKAKESGRRGIEKKEQNTGEGPSAKISKEEPSLNVLRETQVDQLKNKPPHRGKADREKKGTTKTDFESDGENREDTSEKRKRLEKHVQIDMGEDGAKNPEKEPNSKTVLSHSMKTRSHLSKKNPTHAYCRPTQPEIRITGAGEPDRSKHSDSDTRQQPIEDGKTDNSFFQAPQRQKNANKENSGITETDFQSDSDNIEDTSKKRKELEKYAQAEMGEDGAKNPKKEPNRKTVQSHAMKTRQPSLRKNPTCACHHPHPEAHNTGGAQPGRSKGEQPMKDEKTDKSFFQPRQPETNNNGDTEPDHSEDSDPPDCSKDSDCEECEPSMKDEKTEKSFVQEGSCIEVAPKLEKCRECTLRVDNSKGASDSVCRFHSFRKLTYTKHGLAVAGFSDPHKDTSKDDTKLWLSDIENPPADLDFETSKFLLEVVGPHFHDILEREKEALKDNMSNVESVAWKRFVPGVREMCDVCDTTLFNYHWTCGKCGFVVCPDCYKERSQSDIIEGKETDKPDAKVLKLPPIERQATTSGTQQPRLSTPAKPEPKPPFTTSHKPSDKEHVSCNELSSGGEELSEDDPNRLWCICHQPHNNRFMICCDTCSEWYHCDCVDVTEATTRQLDLECKTWMCLFCKNRKNSNKNGSADPHTDRDKFKWLYCMHSNSHEQKNLILSQIIPKDCSQLLVEMASRKRELWLAPTSITSSRPNAPHTWLCYGKVLLLNDPDCEENEKLFQEQWNKGLPVMVADVCRSIDRELWRPEAFARDFGKQKTDLIDCMTGNVLPNQSMANFWEGFMNPEKRLKDKAGQPMLLKLKDWPSREDFADVLPSRFEDLMQSLPMPNYTRRNGKLNLASRLPDCFVKPDLGPKMYNAYGSVSHPDKGTTNLHLDISDAINVMVYVGINEGQYTESIEQVMQAIDGCDMFTKERVSHELPGALWHIYNPCDTDRIRDFLNKVAVERGAQVNQYHDVIHDQSIYIDGPLRERLHKEYGIDGYAMVQCLGDAVFIPAGAPHQVQNLHNCIKVAEDFVSPENVAHCCHLTQEFRRLSDTHSNHEDKLQIKNIIYHSIKDSLSALGSILLS